MIKKNILNEYRKSSIKPPPPPALEGKKVSKPPSDPLIIKTSCGLIRNRLFTNWNFAFDSDPLLQDFQLLVAVLCFSTLYSSSLWRTDIIVVSKLNKVPVSIKPPPPSPSNK